MDKELFRSFINLFPGICHAFVIIREDGRSFLCDDTEILSRHRIRTDLYGDTGGDISNNGADGICDRGVLRNDRAGVEHARYRFQEEMDRSTDTDQSSIGEETGGEEIRLALQSALEALTADTFTQESPSQKEEISLKLQLDQEGEPSIQIDLYRYDGSYCLAVVDGEPVSLVARSSVIDLVEAVNAIVLN